MPRPRREEDARLAALYERVPEIPDCAGHCWISCGPVTATWRERQRLRAAGVRLAAEDTARGEAAVHWCEALGPDGRCTVYQLRPLLCRIWGAVRSMACPHGCTPARWLTTREASDLVAEALEIAGPVSLASPADRLRLAAFGTTLPPAVTRRASAPK